MGKLTYTTKLIFKSETDRFAILEILERQKLAWNEASKVRFGMTQNSIVELHNKFYSDFRTKFPEIPAQIVISAERDVLSSYKSAKSNKHHLKEPPIKNKLSLRLDKRMFSYKNGVFSLISMGHRVKCSPYMYPRLQEMFFKYIFCDPIIFVKNEEIWIGITFDTPEIPVQKTLACGIDLGMRINAATSEGNLYIDKKFNSEKRKIRFIKRKLQSKGTKSARKHLKKLRRKEHNKNLNFTHHLANHILNDTKADVIAMENLKSIKVKKDFKNRNRISQVPIYLLKQILTYKAPFHGKTVIQVNPAYTSQIDSVSKLKDGIRKGRRYYSKSGKIYDSDWNAAINIATVSKHPVSLGRFSSIGTYGQAIVKSPIVCKSSLR